MKLKHLLIVVTSVLLIFSLSIFFFKQYIPFFSKSRVTNVLLYPQERAVEMQKDHRPVDLILYFHGAGCNEKSIFEPLSLGGLDLFMSGNGYPENLLFLSLGYDSNFHWSSPDIVRDTLTKISQIAKEFNTRRIKIIGVSMGGSLALDVLSQADRKLKEKITDVVAVFPIIDYEYTLQNTKRENISKSLKEHFYTFSNPLETMRLSSPITYVSSVPNHTRVILIEGNKDTHICSNRIEDYFEKIKTLNPQNQLLKWDIDHLLTTVSKEFGELIASVLS